MKQKDIALIIVIVAISAMLSFGVARIFLKSNTGQLKAEYVQAITTDFTRPDTKYFNTQSVNPTQLIQIGDDNNVTPYRGAAQ